jgi:hypothetical protein
MPTSAALLLLGKNAADLLVAALPRGVGGSIANITTMCIQTFVRRAASAGVVENALDCALLSVGVR